MAKSTDLATIEATYPALAERDIIAAMQENLGGEKLGQFDLEQIKIPGSGGKFWSIVDDDGNAQPVSTFNAIIVMQRMTRSFWRLSPEESGGEATPPDCSSNDAVVGVGDPGGECDTCAYSQFGSAKNGRGQACSLRRQLFLLTPGSLMPAVLSLPPTSLTAAKQYLLRLGNKGIRFKSVETTFGLEQTTGGGFTYSKATLAQSRRLNEDETAKVDAYAKVLEPIFLAAPVYVAREDDAV